MDYIIIVAGGKGMRMGSEVPKQFLPIGGKPVLMRTLERFHDYDPGLNIILVLPKDQQDFWQRLCREHGFEIAHRIADGGNTRFDSSKNGLALIPDGREGVVGIHDGVRPFVSTDLIARCFDAARKYKAAIPVVPVTDTLRYIEKGRGHNVPRDHYRAVQTPQCFDIALAKQAFDRPCQETFTDDASVVEHMGCRVTMVEGSNNNLKLTTPIDMMVAKVLINHS